MGNRFRARAKERTNEESERRESEKGTSERVVLRWQPPQLHELTSNEKSRPRRSKLGKRRFLKADRVDLKVHFAYNFRRGDERKRRRVRSLLTLLYNIYLLNNKTMCIDR